MKCRDHYVHAPSQWETALQCSAVSHWLGAYPRRIHKMIPEMYLLIEAGWRINSSVNWLSIESDNGLSPDRRLAITWSNVDALSIRPPKTRFNEILVENEKFSFKKMRLKMSSANRRPFCLGLSDHTTVAPKGHHYINFSNAWKNVDVCEKKNMWLCIHTYLACIYTYLACIYI